MTTRAKDRSAGQPCAAAGAVWGTATEQGKAVHQPTQKKSAVRRGQEEERWCCVHVSKVDSKPPLPTNEPYQLLWCCCFCPATCVEHLEEHFTPSAAQQKSLGTTQQQQQQQRKLAATRYTRCHSLYRPAPLCTLTPTTHTYNQSANCKILSCPNLPSCCCCLLLLFLSRDLCWAVGAMLSISFPNKGHWAETAAATAAAAASSRRVAGAAPYMWRVAPLCTPASPLSRTNISLLKPFPSLHFVTIQHASPPRVLCTDQRRRLIGTGGFRSFLLAEP
jgi:hypothetical protein